MEPRIKTRHLEGKRLLGTARQHAVVTDRPREDGGADAGCTSGELLLLAMGSCAAGSLRRFLQEHGSSGERLELEVFFEPAAEAGARDRIVIALALSPEELGFDADALAAAATSGGVNSRMKLGSEIEVRFTGRGGETGV